MKISVCGKGGSGKSVVVALLAAELRRRGYAVLVVDCDESNSALHRILGFDQPPESVLEHIGGKGKLKERMPARPAAGQPAPRTQVLPPDSIPVAGIPGQQVRQADGLTLLSIGKIEHSLEGCACPMGVLSREFLDKLALGEKEIAVADMEAGIEHFGRGIGTSVDAVLIVVEPSFESLQLASRIAQLAAESGVRRTSAILNKVASPEMDARLRKDLAARGIQPVGTVRYDPGVFEASLEGRRLGQGTAAADIRGIADALLAAP